MAHLPTRRLVLQGGLAAAAALAAPRAFASYGLTQIDERLSLLTGQGGNVVVLATPDGAVLVDSGAAGGEPLLPAVQKLTGSRVHTLFNTHWHLEQIGNNEAIGASGANIVAHEKTRLHLAVGHYLPGEDRHHPPVPVAAQPTESFYTTGSTTVGGQHIEYGHLLEAHTDGDAYVYFRDLNVVVAGDAIAPHRDIELDWFGGGWLGGRADSLEQLLDLTDARTRFVPSHGAPVGRAEVAAEHELCLLLFDRFVDRLRKGESNDDMLAAGIMEDTGRTWSDPAKFVHDTHRGFWAHYNTLSHDIV